MDHLMKMNYYIIKLLQFDQETYFNLSIIILLVIVILLMFMIMLLYMTIQEIKKIRGLLERV